MIRWDGSLHWCPPPQFVITPVSREGVEVAAADMVTSSLGCSGGHGQTPVSLVKTSGAFINSDLGNLDMKNIEGKRASDTARPA